MRGSKYLVAMSLLVPMVCAAETSNNEPLTLEQAIVRVLEHSPRLRSAAFAARAAAERITIARLRSPLRVNMEVENFAGTGAVSGADAIESTLSLARVLETGEKPRLRGELAAQKTHLLADDQAAERLDLLADTARRFVHVVTDQERLVIANDTVALNRRILDAVEHRIRAGRTAVTERRRVTIALARSELQLERTAHELAASRVTLSTTWGDTDPRFSSAQANLFVLQPLDDFERLKGLLERNPDLLRFATKQRIGEARIRLAQASRRPDIEISGGLRHLQLTDDVGLVFSASIPFGSSARAAPAIKQAQLANEREPLDYEERRLSLHATLFEIYQQLSYSYSAVETLQNHVIPNAKQALSEYEKGYATGRYSLLELTAAQRVLLDTRLEAIMAANNYHRYRIEIDRLTGAAMNTGAAR